MNISVIGTGYVGLTFGICLCELGHRVICVDKNEDKINSLQNGLVPTLESKLKELLKLGLANNKLVFTTDISYAVKNSDICFICVDTPQLEDGRANTENIFFVAKKIAESINSYKVISVKSTVPVGTCEKIADIIKTKSVYDFDVISNPEFLRQGYTYEDFFNPNRIIIGANSQKALEIMKKVYYSLSSKIVPMDIKSAELTKYAANAFLATKISYINEIANLCEKVGADIEKVKLGLSLDPRIGKEFLSYGLGYGGSCFTKDINALIQTGNENNIDLKIVKSVNEENFNQRKIFIEKIKNRFENNLTNKIFGVWGLAFKPNTDDLRDAPAVTVIDELLLKGAKIKAYDPMAIDNAKMYFKDKIEYFNEKYEVIKNADALLILTDWNEFFDPDFEKMKLSMKSAIIFDGRNILDVKTVNCAEIEYYKFGKK